MQLWRRLYSLTWRSKLFSLACKMLTKDYFYFCVRNGMNGCAQKEIAVVERRMDFNHEWKETRLLIRDCEHIQTKARVCVILYYDMSHMARLHSFILLIHTCFVRLKSTKQSHFDCSIDEVGFMISSAVITAITDKLKILCV